jgi:hypothetical protein
MIKNILKPLVVLLGLSLSTSVFAQSGIGLRLGANFSTVSLSGDDFDDEFEPQNLTGFAFGLVAELGLGENFSLQPELLFSQHGFAIDESLLGQTVIKGEQRYSYLQVPVLAKVKFGPEFFKVNLVLGPHFGFGMGEVKSEFEAFGSGKETSSDSWEDAGLNTFDLGVTGGAGISIGAGPGYLGLDARYQIGLANTLDEPDSDVQARNRNLQFSLSYIIPLGR